MCKKAIREIKEMFHVEPFLHGSRDMFKRSFLIKSSVITGADWDYAIEEPQITFNKYWEKSDLIRSYGWVEIVDQSYYDLNCCQVFEKFFDKNCVQLSFRRNLDEFKTAWDFIHPDFYWKYLHKSSPHFLGKTFFKDYLDMLYIKYAEGVYFEPDRRSY